MNNEARNIERVRVDAAGRRLDLEYAWLRPERRDRPLLVFLHEGLGSVSMWREWPAELCDAAGCRGLVFSRYGYGQSTARPHDERWPVDFMHREAGEVLPAMFAALGMANETPILYGHSDGGSIALLYASMYPQAVRGIVVAAPHIFVEEITLAHIRRARRAYLETDLPQRLGRHHADPDSAFWGWNQVWLDPAFADWNIESYLPSLRCPVLAIQGGDDEYGTLEQIKGIQRHAPQTRLLALPDCGHSPHKDQPGIVIQAVAGFVDELDRGG